MAQPPLEGERGLLENRERVHEQPTGEMMEKWAPMPRDLIALALCDLARFSRDHPAPDLIGYAVAWALLEQGANPSVRRLAADLGWGRTKAGQILKRCRDNLSGWGAKRAPDLPSHRERSSRATDNGRAIEEEQGLSAIPTVGISQQERSNSANDPLLTTATITSSNSVISEEIAEKSGKRPKWIPTGMPVEPFQAAVLRCIETITLRKANPQRCATAAKSVVGLWRAVERPDIEEFAADLCLVAKAAHESPHQLFARDIRGDGWVDGSDRSRSVDTICRRSKFYDRLNAAKDWAGESDASTVESRVERYRAGLISERPDFSRLPEMARADRQGEWELATEKKVTKYREWLVGSCQ